MASKKINRLTNYVTGQIINANEHNAEHQQYVDNLNELFLSFDYDGTNHYLIADKTKFNFTSLNLEQILSNSHNPDGTVKADKVIKGTIDVSSFLDVAHNPDGTIKSNGIDDPLIYAHNNDTLSHTDIRQSIIDNVNTHNTDINAHQDIRNELTKLLEKIVPKSAKYEVGATFPTSPSQNHLFYDISNNRLYRYNGTDWEELDWQTIVKYSPDWITGNLRIENGQLQVSPDGLNWYNCIPALGASDIEILTVDNQNYSYLYFILPNTSVKFTNVNHIPIVYSSAIEPEFIIFTTDNSSNYNYGLRPSAISLSDGTIIWDGCDINTSNTPYSTKGIDSNLPVFPINSIVNAAKFTGKVKISSTQKFYGFFAIFGGLSTYSGYKAFISVVSEATAPTNSFWLGDLYDMTISGNINLQSITVTRIK